MTLSPSSRPCALFPLQGARLVIWLMPFRKYSPGSREAVSQDLRPGFLSADTLPSLDSPPWMLRTSESSGVCLQDLGSTPQVNPVPLLPWYRTCLRQVGSAPPRCLAKEGGAKELANESLDLSPHLVGTAQTGWGSEWLCLLVAYFLTLFWNHKE